MDKVTVILTCYNRKKSTLNCIKKLLENNKNVDLEFIIVDDNSLDGTREAIIELKRGNIKLIEGNGNLFWNRGMYEGIKYLLNRNERKDYVLLVNDDVNFFDNCIEKLINQSKKSNGSVIVGATRDNDNNFTYGGIRIVSKFGIKTENVKPTDSNLLCDTINANCVLIPYYICKDVGNLDLYYSHRFGDHDYGFQIRRKGYEIFSSTEYVGICTKNEASNTWMDRDMGIIKRLKLKENQKGLPFKEWFYYLNKNFGITKAIIFSITPYIKIFKTALFK